MPEVVSNAAHIPSEASPSPIKEAISRLGQPGLPDYVKQLGVKRVSMFSLDLTFADTLISPV